MRWPIRNQIFFPFAAVLLAAVASIAVTMALLAARRGGLERVDQLHRVETALADASFPFTRPVLMKMSGLSGAEFVALDSRDGIVTSTFAQPAQRGELPEHLPASGPPKRLEEFDAVDFRGTPYYAAVLPGNGFGEVASLLILYPQENLRRARWEAAWPPLAIGGATILLMIPLSAWLSRRLSRRIESIRALFGRIADGRFITVEAEPPLDEIHDLVASANRLSERLAAMTNRIARTERLRLLAQLAGGLAHQLRNAVAGARMAIQLHRRRCRGSQDDGSLDIALQQLALTEEHVRGLLTLGREESRPPVPGVLSEILTEIERLLLPAARHLRVSWHCTPPAELADVAVANVESLRAGLLNVVLNAIEAAGAGGRVRLWVEQVGRVAKVCVADTGPGPHESVRSTMFEPFVTSKPEGVGLGLALAQAAAEEHGGSVSWSRIDGETVFTISLDVAGAACRSLPDDCRSPHAAAKAAEFSRLP